MDDSDLIGGITECLSQGFTSFGRVEENDSNSSLSKDAADGSIIKRINSRSFELSDPLLKIIGNSCCLNFSEGSEDLNSACRLFTSLNAVVVYIVDVVLL